MEMSHFWNSVVLLKLRCSEKHQISGVSSEAWHKSMESQLLLGLISHHEQALGDCDEEKCPSRGRNLISLLGVMNKQGNRMEGERRSTNRFDTLPKWPLPEKQDSTTNKAPFINTDEHISKDQRFIEQRNIWRSKQFTVQHQSHFHTYHHIIYRIKEPCCFQ